MLNEQERNLRKMVRAVRRHCDGSFDFVARMIKVAKRLQKHGDLGRKVYAEEALMMISDERNLYVAMMHLYDHGGCAAGPDGETPSVYDSVSERFQACRALREVIRDQSYMPDGYHVNKIPKASGSGVRKIAVQNLTERVVQRGIAQVLGAMLDPGFVDGSYGYRPKRSREMALAKVEELVYAENRHFWITADIQDAFDNVPLKPVLELLDLHFPAENLRPLLTRSIRLHERKRGLLQGSPLSGLLLILYLHHKLDKPFAAKCPGVRLFRWSDDILLMCKTHRQAKKAAKTLVSLMDGARLTLKGGNDLKIVDLRTDDRVLWLGYDCGSEDGVFDVRIAERAVHSMQDRIRELEVSDNPLTAAVRRLCGWFKSAGPAFSESYAERTVKVFIEELHQLGLEDTTFRTEWGDEFDVLDAEAWLGLWKACHKKWIKRHCSK